MRQCGGQGSLPTGERLECSAMALATAATPPMPRHHHPRLTVANPAATPLSITMADRCSGAPAPDRPGWLFRRESVGGQAASTASPLIRAATTMVLM